VEVRPLEVLVVVEVVEGEEGEGGVDQSIIGQTVRIAQGPFKGL